MFSGGYGVATAFWVIAQACLQTASKAAPL